MCRKVNFPLLFRFGIFLLLLISIYPWFIWESDLILYASQCYVIVVSVLYKSFCKNDFHPWTVITFFFFLLCVLIGIWDADVGYAKCFVLFAVLPVILCLKLNELTALLSFITKWFSLLFLLSLVFYVLYLFGYNFFTPSIVEYSDLYSSFNYYLFLIPTSSFDIRFSSISMEPGHMTMLIVPLIIANKFNLHNRYVVILVIVELFTFSLAGFITLLIGYVFFFFRLAKLKSFIIAAFVFLMLLFSVDLIFPGSLDVLLFDRFDFSNGSFVVDNRVTSHFQTYFNSFLYTDNIWFGDPSVDITSFGGISGYKKYLVQNGLMGLLSIVFLYGYFFILYRKFSLFVLTFISYLLLYQNGYPFWYCMILIYCIFNMCFLREYSKNLKP